MTRKRSFFERLTGAVRLDDDERDFDDNQKVTHIPVTHSEKTPSWADEEIESELAVDVYQTPTHLVLKTMIAGVRPDDVDVQISRDLVVIKGRREDEKEISHDDYYVKELYWGTFSRSVVLPVEVEPEEAEAIERHGLLMIKIPKIDRKRQTKLKIKTNT
jgi:HSP20 family molecular chaperone IbpA